MTTRSQKAGKGGESASPSQTPGLKLQAPVEKGINMEDMRKLFEGLESKMEKNKDEIEQRIEKGLKASEANMDQKLNAYNAEMKEDIVAAFKSVWKFTQDVQERVVEVEGDVLKIAQQVEVNRQVTVENRQRIEDEVTTREYRQMEWALRIRGINDRKEMSPAELKHKIAEILAPLVEEHEEDCLQQIDRVYRVDSWVARQRNLPRDVVVYFTTRRVRNYILAASYDNRITVDGKDLTVMKELPRKMLRDRKDFTFLTAELRKQGIRYRWEVPTGMNVTYEGKRYKLLTERDARQFYSEILRGGEGASAEGASNGAQRDKEDQKRKEREGEEQMRKADERQKKMIAVWEKAVIQEPENKEIERTSPGMVVDIFDPLPKEVPEILPAIKDVPLPQRIKESESKVQAKQLSQEAMGARPKDANQEMEVVVQRLIRKVRPK